MTDYGHELRFGTFLTPTNAQPEAVVGLAQLSEQVGLDLVTFQDHPYQPWFLTPGRCCPMSPHRQCRSGWPPTCSTCRCGLRRRRRAAASLDLLSGGRIDLGLGAGAFGDAVAAMGGPRRTPGEAVEALEEAITVLRQLWDTGTRGGVRLAGKHYSIEGAKRGPAPAHPIDIWIGAYKPRMLRLTGRVADGWLPSAGYLGPEALAEANLIIDEAAEAAGRVPADVRRLYNISGSFTGSGDFLKRTTAPVGGRTDRTGDHRRHRHLHPRFRRSGDDHGLRRRGGSGRTRGRSRRTRPTSHRS